MYSINEKQFEDCLKEFLETARNIQKEKYGFEDLSFSEGYLREQEWYKHKIIKEASKILDYNSWRRSDVGTGKIIDQIKKAFHIKVNSGQQNIIDWRDLERAEEILDNNLIESERVLFDLFTQTSEEEAFNSAIELFGRRYAVITYLLFIKDSKQFVPVRTRRFKNQFNKLGITTSCLEYCSWNNYQEFLEILRWVKKQLDPIFSDVSLIDAHSIVWMMWILDPDEESEYPSDEDDGAFLTGSPEWFFDKSQTQRMVEINEMIEDRREVFLEAFSPEKLSLMNGEELLNKVFSDSPDSMMRLLMFDDDYRWFGAAGKYKYLGVVYQGSGETWVYKEGSHSQKITKVEAEKKAETIRDALISCVSEIENIGVFHTIQDYNTLKSKINDVFFFQYTWMMKYYQMLYPQFFPGMYANKTLSRALHILGLPNHGTSERLLNAGEISLFIRKCNVNNILFNQIYDDEWGWEEEVNPCRAAATNYQDCEKPVSGVVTKYYKTPTGTESRKRERINQAIEIETEISSHHLEGKEKQAVVKVRVNQGEFRNRLLRKYKKCCLCGVSNPALLVRATSNRGLIAKMMKSSMQIMDSCFALTTTNSLTVD